MQAWVTRGAGEASTSGRGLQGRHATRRRLAYGRLFRMPPALRSLSTNAGMPDRNLLSSQEDYSFSLTQYMVVLDKPIGLTLAPDPTTGQVYVQHIQQGMSAADSRLVLVGDRLLSCSAVFGDEMWHASDLQRTRWAINNRPGKVKLVLERGVGGAVPPWYFRGRQGIATWEVPELQLPIRFVTAVGGELAESVAGVGRSMSVSFSRCMNPTPPDHSRRPVLRPGVLARRARSEALLLQLSEAAAAPEVDISSPVSRLLAGRDGARFQVGVSGTPLQPGGTTNVLPFRRHSSGSSTPGGSSSSSQIGGSSSNNSNSSSNNPSNNTNNIPSTSSSSGAPAAAVMGAPAAAAAAGGCSSSSSSSSSSGAGNGSSWQSGSSSSPAAAASAAWGGSAAAAAGGGGGGGVGPVPVPVPAREKKVVQVLPWLLVSNGRLNTNDLTRLATTRALGCLLEMTLTLNHEGLLCPGGSQPPAFSLPADPVPPTLSPSTVPAPAPATPPPFPTAVQQQQQQQEQTAVADDAGAVAAGLVGIAGPDMGFASSAAAAAAVAAAAVAAPPAEQQQQQGLQGSDSSQPADTTAAADPANNCSSSSSSPSGAAAATTQQQQQQSGGGAVHSTSGSSTSSDGSSSSAAAAAPQEPSPVTLQAHAILHCIADLHRLSVRRRWTPRRGIGWHRTTSPPPAISPLSPSVSSSPSPGGLTTGPQLGSAAGGLGALGSGGLVGGGLAGQSQGGLVGQGGLGGVQGGFASQASQQPSSQLLLNCEEGSWGGVGVLLVAWLHWHCGVEQTPAVEAVSKALGVPLDVAVLSEVRRLLVVRAKERFNRLMLTWPYGGLSAEVSGELVGGWTERVAMTRCMKPEGCLGASKGHFFLELQGLHPGKYHYKYIIDNTWDVDPCAPQILDSQGNWNNVLEVRAPPRIESAEEQSHFAALQALCMAFERKLRPVGSLLNRN